MNADTFKGQWKQLKGELKSRWGKLTDDDLMQIDGNLDKLIGSIETRYGYAKDQAQKEFQRWYEARKVSSASEDDQLRDAWDSDAARSGSSRQSR